MTPSRETRIPGTELTRVLDLASELQRRSDRTEDGAISLADLESAAAEAGIEPRFVRAAARSLALEREAAGDGLFGPDSVWAAEAWIRGGISEQDAHRVLARLQSLLPVAGGRIESPSEGIWRLAEGGRATIQVTLEEDETNLVVVSDRTWLKRGLVGGGAVVGGVVLPQVLAPVALGMMGGEVVMETVGYLIGGGIVGGAVGGGAAGLGLWKAIAARWRRRAEAALSQVRELFGSME